jgi:hypothetical protein
MSESDQFLKYAEEALLWVRARETAPARACMHVDPGRGRERANHGRQRHSRGRQAIGWASCSHRVIRSGRPCEEATQDPA